MLRSDDYLSGIGGLVQNPYWKKKLPLAPAQADALMKLDKLVWNSRLKSYIPDAEYMETNPADYQDYSRRSDARRADSIRHAQCMVAVGILTEPQAGMVMQNTVSDSDYLLNHLRYDLRLQELLGLTESQKE